MARGPLEPQADGLVFMARDLFGPTQAAPSPHDQQCLGHLRGRSLQPIQGRPLRLPKVGLAALAVIALSASMTPIAHHMGLLTVGIWTRGQTALLLLLWLVHASPPLPYSITP